MNWKTATRAMCVCVVVAALAGVTRKMPLAAEQGAATESGKDFFPMAVWYSGGKRARRCWRN